MKDISKTSKPGDVPKATFTVDAQFTCCKAKQLQGNSVTYTAFGQSINFKMLFLKFISFFLLWNRIFLDEQLI